MTVKYRKAFFTDLANINQLEYIKDIEFITDGANIASTPLDIPGFKWLRHIPEWRGLSVCLSALV